MGDYYEIKKTRLGKPGISMLPQKLMSEMNEDVVFTV